MSFERARAPVTPAVAAAGNAAWCDLVCGLHDVASESTDVVWTSRSRSPELFPDAVTLAPDLELALVIDRIDTSPGCSVKDSFASLDLTAHGFDVLFSAQWIVHPGTSAAPPPSAARWATVDTEDAFASWEEAWRREGGAAGVLSVELLHEDAVTVLVERDGGRDLGGAILHRAGQIVGISNVFARAGRSSADWGGLVAAAVAVHPGSPLVGYESDAALDAALAHGFESIGPLRVWVATS